MPRSGRHGRSQRGERRAGGHRRDSGPPLATRRAESTSALFAVAALTLLGSVLYRNGGLETVRLVVDRSLVRMNGRRVAGDSVNLTSYVVCESVTRALSHKSAAVVGRRDGGDGRVRLRYDRAALRRPWALSTDDGRVELELTPAHVKTTNALTPLAGARIDLAFGTFRGRLRTEDGAWVEVREHVSWAEDFSAAW